jgi:hypothetical protein
MKGDIQLKVSRNCWSEAVSEDGRPRFAGATAGMDYSWRLADSRELVGLVAERFLK